ncbi:hypothetical protein, partial [Draconibacterium sp.]|uniref:hypothetical protein n=1 Tax=Draconibacterium sp. TaxID=1965318 RepID=UPI00356AB68B
MKLKRFFILATVAVSIIIVATACAQKTTTPQQELTKHDEEINEIIKGMSLEEKVEMLHSKT